MLETERLESTNRAVTMKAVKINEAPSSHNCGDRSGYGKGRYLLVT